MTTFLLVHGSHGGGWIWQKVAPLLRAEGYEVYAPTLTGLSDRAHLLECGVDLTTHIKDIDNLLFYEDLNDVILVGNSYAGMVITGVIATAPERLKLVVYLDAYLPDEGQSESDLWPAEMKITIENDDAAKKGVRFPSPPAFFGITQPELAEWVKARWTPQPLSTYNQPVPISINPAKSASVPRAYIHCTGAPTTTTPIFAVSAAKARAAGWPVYELESGHLSMLTAPRELSDMMMELAVEK